MLGVMAAAGTLNEKKRSRGKGSGRKSGVTAEERMAIPLRIGIYTFRTLNDPLFGELHVIGGSLRRRGARRFQNPAKGSSPRSLAGSDDGDGPTDGGSAHTSAAHAAGQGPCADLAGTDGPETERAPKEEGGEDGPPPKQWKRDLPRDPFEYASQVNQQAQLVDVAAGILNKPDDRIKQKVLQQVLSLAYARSARRTREAREDEPEKLTWNLPR